MRRKGRWTLAALFFVCVLPVAASYFAFYVWQPQDRMNYGTLISPEALPDSVLADMAGRPVGHDMFKGAWTYLVVAPADCDAACQDALYLTRQVRTAQDKEMERVGRAWLLVGEGQPDAALIEAHPGLVVMRADAAWQQRFAADPMPRVWLVDPRGEVMMRYPVDLEAKGMIKDLARLLKYSQVG